MRSLLSLILFGSVLTFVITKFSLLEHYGLHGIGIGCLLFYGISLFGITGTANEEGDSERERWRRYARYLVITHISLISVFAIIHAIRKGIRYLFNHVLPDGYQDLGEYMFIAIFLGLISGIIYLAYDRPDLLKKWMQKIGIRINM